MQRTRTTQALRSVLVALLALLVTVALLGSTPAEAGKKKKRKPPTWAPAATAQIHPGVETVTAGAQCTANFVFVDKRFRVYLGQAAHCGGDGEATETDGCLAPAAKPGTPVRISNLAGEQVAQGTLAYNSWFTMQRRGERDPDACAFNDFALIRLPKSAVRTVNPSLPVHGGPTGIRTTGLDLGERLYTYGNSSLRFGLSATSPKECYALGSFGWVHDHYCANPGIPGDSGSAFVDASGRAVGTLSTLNSFPPASNTATDMARQLAYAQKFSGIKRLRLVPGTERFTPAALGFLGS
jgi:hypothetical protein